MSKTNKRIKVGKLYQYNFAMSITLFDLDLNRCIKQLHKYSVVMVLSNPRIDSICYKVIDSCGEFGVIVMHVDSWDELNECC